MARYKLTQTADRDFENIFDFGIDRFGLAQALEYQNGMKERFAQLAAQPDLYQVVDHIRQGYRRSVFQAHSIYYKVDNGRILIVRFLGVKTLKHRCQSESFHNACISNLHHKT